MSPQFLLSIVTFFLLAFSCQSEATISKQTKQGQDTATALASPTELLPSREPVVVQVAEKAVTPNARATDKQTSSAAKPQAPTKPTNTAIAERASAPATPAPAAQETSASAPATSVPSRPDHQAWDELLRNYVSASGQVDYRALRAKKEQLAAYLAELAKQPPQADWPPATVKAYWVNAYNAFTVKLILDNYPLASIRDLDGGNPWDTKWIELGTETYSLNQIEHSILRPRFEDARIHFAVNCAAASCPPLHNRAFTASNTERLLTQLAKDFINNDAYNTITEQKVVVSKIFEWYQADFGELRAYLNKYSDTMIESDTPIEFKAYDWALNER